MRPRVAHQSHFGTVTGCGLGGAPVRPACFAMAPMNSTGSLAGPTQRASLIARLTGRQNIDSVSTGVLHGRQASTGRLEESSNQCFCATGSVRHAV